MERFNSQPMPRKQLWQLSRADAEANVKEKDGYDPSK